MKIDKDSNKDFRYFLNTFFKMFVKHKLCVYVQKELNYKDF